jgi:prepilin-type N-terminal cleavage/methylation domain-containing protein
MSAKIKQVKGFSLIEILVTLFILAVILVTLIGVFIYGFNLVSRTKQVNLATQIAQEEVERFRNMDFATIIGITTVETDLSALSSSEYPSLFGPAPEYNLLLLNGTQTVTVQDVPYDSVSEIKKLTVNITWDYRGQTQEKNIVTYLFREGINKKS